MDAMLIVDMQVGLLNGEPKHDLRGVIDRINRLAARVREQVGIVIFIQHCGCDGDDFEPQTPGWALLPELIRDPADLVVQKQMNDPFAGAELQARLNRIAPDRVLVTGWATDLCVDADRPIRRLKPSQRRRGDRRPYIERPPSPRCARRDPASPLGLEPSHHPKTGQARNDRRAAGLTRMTRPVRP